MPDNNINLAALWVPVMAETSHIKDQLRTAGTEGRREFEQAFSKGGSGGIFANVANQMSRELRENFQKDSKDFFSKMGNQYGQEMQAGLMRGFGSNISGFDRFFNTMSRGFDGIRNRSQETAEALKYLQQVQGQMSQSMIRDWESLGAAREGFVGEIRAGQQEHTAAHQKLAAALQVEAQWEERLAATRAENAKRTAAYDEAIAQAGESAGHRRTGAARAAAAEEQRLLVERAENARSTAFSERTLLESLATAHHAVGDAADQEAQARRRLDGVLAANTTNMKNVRGEYEKSIANTRSGMAELEQDFNRSLNSQSSGLAHFAVTSGLAAGAASAAVNVAVMAIQGLAHAAVEAFSETVHVVEQVADEVLNVGKAFQQMGFQLEEFTTASGAQLAELQQAAAGVFAQLDTGGQDVGKTMGIFAQRLHASGAEVSDLTRYVTELGDRFGHMNADTLSGIFLKFGVDVNHSTDVLASFLHTAQNAGLNINQILDPLATAGDEFKDLGLNAQQSAALVAELLEKHIALQRVMVGFSTAQKVFTDKHMDLATGLAEASKELQHYHDVGDKVNEDALAEKLFGNRNWEEAIEGIRAYIGITKQAPDAFDAAAASMDPLIQHTHGLEQAWQAVKQQIATALHPAGAGAVGGLEKIIDGMAAAIHRNMGSIQHGIKDLGDHFIHFLPTMQQWAEAFIGIFADVAQAVSSTFGYIVGMIGTTIKSITEPLKDILPDWAPGAGIVKDLDKAADSFNSLGHAMMEAKVGDNLNKVKDWVGQQHVDVKKLTDDWDGLATSMSAAGNDLPGGGAPLGGGGFPSGPTWPGYGAAPAGGGPPGNGAPPMSGPGSLITVGPGGTNAPGSAGAALTGKDQIAGAIIGEAARRGFSPTQTVAILSTAMDESGLDQGQQGGGGAWHGIFQQNTSYPNRDNAAGNIQGFFDRLGAPAGDVWGQIFALQQGKKFGDPGARTAYMGEIQGHQGEALQLYERLAGAAGGAHFASGGDVTRKAGSPLFGGMVEEVGSGFLKGIAQAAGLGSVLDKGPNAGVMKLIRSLKSMGQTGGPSGTDTVPAWLTPGEFVVNADSTAMFLPLLRFINAKRYADGGQAFSQVIWSDTETGQDLGENNGQWVGTPGSSDPGFYHRGHNDFPDHTGHVHTTVLADPFTGQPYTQVKAGSDIRQGQPGFPDWVYRLGQQYHVVPSTYPGHQEWGGINHGIDWWPADATPNMQGAGYTHEDHVTLTGFAQAVGQSATGTPSPAGSAGSGSPGGMPSGSGGSYWAAGSPSSGGGGSPFGGSGMPSTGGGGPGMFASPSGRPGSGPFGGMTFDQYKEYQGVQNEYANSQTQINDLLSRQTQIQGQLDSEKAKQPFGDDTKIQGYQKDLAGINDELEKARKHQSMAGMELQYKHFGAEQKDPFWGGGRYGAMAEELAGGALKGFGGQVFGKPIREWGIFKLMSGLANWGLGTANAWSDAIGMGQTSVTGYRPLPGYGGIAYGAPGFPGGPGTAGGLPGMPALGGPAAAGLNTPAAPGAPAATPQVFPPGTTAHGTIGTSAGPGNTGKLGPAPTSAPGAPAPQSGGAPQGFTPPKPMPQASGAPPLGLPGAGNAGPTASGDPNDLFNNPTQADQMLAGMAPQAAPGSVLPFGQSLIGMNLPQMFAQQNGMVPLRGSGISNDAAAAGGHSGSAGFGGQPGSAGPTVMGGFHVTVNNPQDNGMDAFNAKYNSMVGNGGIGSGRVGTASSGQPLSGSLPAMNH